MNHQIPAFVIIPGGGSPYSPTCSPVYSALEHEAKRRGFIPYTLDYTGCGHEPTVEGLMLSTSVARITKLLAPILTNHKKVVIHGQSYGCSVIAALKDIVLWNRVSRLVYWAPIPLETYKGVYGTPSLVQRRNEQASVQQRGVIIDSKFVQSLGVEITAVPQVPRLIIALSVTDRLTSVAHARRLEHHGLLNGSSVDVRILTDCPHEVTEPTAPYLEAIFQP